jgi:acetyltransferase-like isoleucine patch superfamily enzyme
MIEIEDKVTIGGSVHIIAHYASKGFLIVERVKIRKGATVGLKATIMGDVEIGEGAVIAPHEVILPKSRIPAGRKPYVAEEKEALEKKDLPSQDFL